MKVTDIHVHIQPRQEMTASARRLLIDARPADEQAFLQRLVDSPVAFLDLLDRCDVDRAGIVNYPAPHVMGFTEAANEWVSAYCDEDRARLLPIGGVDPASAASAGGVRDAVERCVSDLGLRALKLHPAHMLVWPDALYEDSRGFAGHGPHATRYGDRLRALYESCSEAGVPLMVHTGTSRFPGARNAMCDPLLLDDVASEFPELRLILAHAGRPLWTRQAVFMARRHPNVWLDLSGIPPASLAQALPELPKLWDKCLWGTDWPGPGLPSEALRTNVDAFRRLDLGLAEDAVAAILDGNSRRLFA